MRAVVAGLLAALCPAVALAQAPAASAPTPPPPAASASAPAPPAAAGPRRRGGADITRDDYIDRAKRAAERRFDAMDANHDGVLTADERRAYRASHHRRGAEPAEPEPQPAKPQ